MQLRQENENVMDTLVRTKVELAETQGASSSQACCWKQLKYLPVVPSSRVIP